MAILTNKNKTQLVRAITWQCNSRLSSVTVWFMWPVLAGHLEHGSKLSTRKTRASSIWRVVWRQRHMNRKVMPKSGYTAVRMNHRGL